MEPVFILIQLLKVLVKFRILILKRETKLEKGGEVEKKWFQDNFIGKKIFNNLGELMSITVVKGKVGDVYSGDQIQHGVDGISGATITSNGVTTFLKRDLNKYKNYFQSNK